jgi:trk system potassium uptake protein TrkH
MNDEAGRSWLRSVRQFLTVLVAVMVALGTVSLAIQYGFEPARYPFSEGMLIAVQAAAVVLFILRGLTGLILSPLRTQFIRSRWLESIAVAIGLAALAIDWATDLRVSTVSIVAVQVVLVVELLVYLSWANALLIRRGHPARLMVASFAAAILIGGALLSLPKASKPLRIRAATSVPRHVLNCYFTAVSATCVTGLIVYDTPKEFTLFGQLIILAMIQAGGLGIIIFGTLFALLIGQQLSLGGSVAMQDMLSGPNVGQIGRMVRFVVLVTLLIEGIGAAVLYPMWDPTITSQWQRLFLSVFHAVSAFCNAGFTLQSDNMVGYKGAWQLYGSIMPLIILGGLGFPVLRDVYEWLGAKLIPRYRNRPTQGIAGRTDKLNLHTKLALAMTAILIVGGAAILLLFETPSRLNPRYPSDLSAGLRPKAPVMAGEPLPQRILDGLFQSVTTRTAGFNTIPTTLSAMSPASLFVMMILMFIGGSPASTAGGIKTVTMAVILLAVRATIRRRDEVEVFGRTISALQIRHAATVLILMLGMVAVSTLLLAFSESEHAGFLELLFEEVSGLCTVGLSCGVTPELTAFGKCVIMANMFIGRLGPLTLLVAMAGRRRTSRYGYAEEGVIIG